LLGPNVCCACMTDMSHFDISIQSCFHGATVVVRMKSKRRLPLSYQ